MKKHCLHFLLYIVYCFAYPETGSAQVIDSVGIDIPEPSYLDISKIRLARNITTLVETAYFENDADFKENFATTRFTLGLIHQKTIPNDFVMKTAAVRFNIKNSADTTAGVYFFPGLYYEEIKIFFIREGLLEQQPYQVPEIRDSMGYRFISLPAHDSVTVLAQLKFVRTYVNTLRPRLINSDFVSSFVAELHNIHEENELMTYVFCGLLLMMILYSIANFLQGSNPEFLYYSGYAFFLGTMLFTKAMFTYHATELSYFLEGYLDFIMQCLGIMFYMIFMQKYLSTKTMHPFLHGLYNSGIGILIVAMASFTFFHYFIANFSFENAVENITKVILLVMTLVFLVYSLLHWSDRLMRYLFWGNLCLFVFSLVSQVIIMDRGLVKSLPMVFQSAVFYYELGLFLELVFFLMALNHKSRRQLIAQARERERLKAENQMKEYEKELAVFKAQQQERERISADMHDELGSGMTAIRLMSEIARNKMKNETPVEIEKISHSADEVLNKMNAIIWSMNSENDTMDSMVSYIRSYSLEYFENTPIHCRITTPESIPATIISGDKRRNIFLCIKETLNNALKHSRATEIHIDFKIGNNLIVRITDNGIGIDKENIRQFGNGLKNITRRMESIGGSYTIESDRGTITTLKLPL